MVTRTSTALFSIILGLISSGILSKSVSASLLELFHMKVERVLELLSAFRGMMGISHDVLPVKSSDGVWWFCKALLCYMLLPAVSCLAIKPLAFHFYLCLLELGSCVCKVTFFEADTIKWLVCRIKILALPLINIGYQVLDHILKDFQEIFYSYCIIFWFNIL